LAVDRWFGNIPIGANYWNGGTFVADEDYDNYFIMLKAQTDAASKLMQLKVINAPEKIPLDNNDNPIYVEGFRNPAIYEQAKYFYTTIRKLRENTVSYILIKPAAAGIIVSTFGIFAVLPKDVGKRRWTRIKDELYDDAIEIITIIMDDTPDTNEWVGEYHADIDNYPIIQPAHQGGAMQGSVADQLNIVSTSTNDAAAGTGMRKCMIKYYDSNLTLKSYEATLNGTTPVNLITHIPDLYLIKTMYGTEFGTSGKNEGIILLQDDA